MLSPGQPHTPPGADQRCLSPGQPPLEQGSWFPRVRASPCNMLQDNVLLAAGVGAAVLGGLFLVLTSKRKGPVCPGPGRLRRALSVARVARCRPCHALQLPAPVAGCQAALTAGVRLSTQVFLDKSRQKAPLLEKIKVPTLIIPARLLAALQTPLTSAMTALAALARHVPVPFWAAVQEPCPWPSRRQTLQDLWEHAQPKEEAGVEWS